MTLQMVEVITDRNETLQFPLGGNNNGYEVHNIDGLEPVKAEIVASDFGTVDGTQYQASRRGQRNIVMTLGYSPNHVTNNISSLRQALNSKLMPNTPITMKFYRKDDVTLTISGRVESCDTPLFQEDPEATVSILCSQPDFTDITPNTITAYTSNDNSELDINYFGNIDVGFLFKLFAIRPVNDFSLRIRDSIGRVGEIVFDGDLIYGDTLEISTIPGRKGAWRIRDDDRESVLYHIAPESIYKQLSRGVNNIRAYSPGDPIPYEITYLTTYGSL